MSKQSVFVIEPNGNIRNLIEDSDDMLKRIAGSVVRITRNSYVETWHSLDEKAKQNLLDRSVVEGDKIAGSDLPLAEAWWADMSPVRGPVLGPFTTREDALEAELTWLRNEGLPIADGDIA